MKSLRRISSFLWLPVVLAGLLPVCAAALENLDGLVKEAGLSPVISGGKAGHEYHKDFTVEKAFDGITFSQDANKRWLGSIQRDAFLQYEVPEAFFERCGFFTSAYRIHALSCGFGNDIRTMTAWSLYARQNETQEWMIIDHREGITWPFITGADKSKPESYIREFEFASGPLHNYRFFKFVPELSPVRETTPGEIWTAGLMEFVLLGTQGGEQGFLEISGNQHLVGDVTPGYGTLDNPAAGQTIDCSAAPYTAASGSKYQCVGYALDQQVGESWISKGTNWNATSFRYDKTNGKYRLTWLWKLVGHRLETTVVDGPETVMVTPAPNEDGFYDIGTTVSLVPRGQTDPASRFDRWSGDVDAGHETDAPLVIVMDKPREIAATFVRSWKLVAKETSGAPHDLITDGNWSIYVEPEAISVYKGHEIATGDTKPFVSGHGILDLTTLLSDTTARGTPIHLSLIRSIAIDSSTNLTGLVLGNDPILLGANAFQNCDEIRFVEMGDEQDVQLASRCVFADCDKLERVKLSDRLEEIGPAVFRNCPQLKTVTPFLPASVKKLDASFANCPSLTGNPDLTHVETMGGEVFRDCEKITGPISLPALKELFGQYQFYGAGITSADLSTITNIPGHFLRESMVQSVVLSDATVEFGEAAFLDCTRLGTVRPWLPDSVTTIGSSAFRGCTALRTTPRMANVKELGFWAFRYDRNMSGPIEMPALVDIGARDDTNPGFHFSETGISSLILPRIDFVPKGFAHATPRLREVVLSKTELGAFSASAFQSSGLSRIDGVFPPTLTNVEYMAFARCPNLHESGRLVFPKGTVFGDHVFDSSNVDVVDLMKTRIRSVTDRMFRSTVFNAVYLPETVEVIESGAFANYGGLKQIFFCGGVPALPADDWAYNMNNHGLDWQIRLYVPKDLHGGWKEAIVAGDLSDKPNHDKVQAEKPIGSWEQKWVMTWLTPEMARRRTLPMIR